jgi:hypothetical protein
MNSRERPGSCRHADRRVWYGTLGLMTLALAAGLGLIIALARGWNDPRPTRPPDWQAPGLPVSLQVATGEAVVTLLDHPSSDFILEIEAVPLSGPDFNGYGLIYRAQDATHYTVFAVGSDGYYGVLRVTGEEETPLVDWQQFPHVHRGGQSNRLSVACAGPTCHFTINDEYATTVVDDTWLAGDIGLWVRGFGEGSTTVQFQDARVWEE